MNNELIEKFKMCVMSDCIELNPPCSIIEIEAFEQKYNVKLPLDLKSFFLCFNGTGLGNFGHSGYAFSSIQEFKPWLQESNLTNDEKKLYKNCFVLADYMMWSWGYIIDLTPENNIVYSVLDVAYPKNIVAKNFSEFIEKYLNKYNQRG